MIQVNIWNQNFPDYGDGNEDFFFIDGTVIHVEKFCEKDIKEAMKKEPWSSFYGRKYFAHTKGVSIDTQSGIFFTDDWSVQDAEA